jgi:hypothetical protein
MKTNYAILLTLLVCSPQYTEALRLKQMSDYDSFAQEKSETHITADVI